MDARIAALGLGPRVHLTGFRNDIPDVMNAWDILVHASVRPEPFGRVILEGMLLGKPVIATAAGGVPELIEDNRTGWLVPPGDAEALARCLQRALSAPAEARAIGSRAREWAREQFSLARQVAEMSEIYEGATRTRTS
jgi:glycosyltransferase involved in cell wall biosynthesis